MLHNSNHETILNEENEENTLAIYLEDESINYIPEKDSGYTLDLSKSNCTNGVELDFDYNNWTIKTNYSNYESTDNTRVKCSLYFTDTYIEPLLNGTEPVLEEPLIPVTISDDGTVRKADLASEWYDYETKKWANAIILEDSYEYLSQSGKVYGATKEDGYVTFDGVDDYVDLGLENYDFGNSITLSFQFTLLDSNFTEPFTNVQTAGAGFFYNDGNISFQVYIDELNQYQYISTPISIGQEYTITGTYDGTTIKLYVNNELKESLNVTGSIRVSTMPYLLGANPEANEQHYDWSKESIKRALIYNRAITEEELAALTNEKVINNDGLLRYVDFTNKTYETNEVIPEENIESYFVWIPKYRYQLWDLGLYDSLTTIDSSKVHEIPIIFGDYNTSDNVSGECSTPMESGATGNCEVGEYMTHPAFLSIPSTGFWVGKFETGYKGATSVTEAQVNENDSSKVIIKPNVYAWRDINLANAHLNSYNYQRELDSHMMKNTEWGAVAYLQHSVYGSSSSVRINNNSAFLTGYQAKDEPTCGSIELSDDCHVICNDNSCNVAYPNSVLSSTTGNIAGIFDMSGGSWEFMMSVMLDENGKPMSGSSSTSNSGFNGSYSLGGTLTTGYDWPENKYYDSYLFSDLDNSNFLRVLGDAMGELGTFSQTRHILDSAHVLFISSWYDDFARPSCNGFPSMLRGGYCMDGNNTGIFAFYRERGIGIGYISFRIVLTPTN